MEITLAEKGVFVLPANVTQGQAREKAWEQTLNVFGTLAKFLMRRDRCQRRSGGNEYIIIVDA